MTPLGWECELRCCADEKPHAHLMDPRTERQEGAAMSTSIEAGAWVVITDAEGDEYEAEALSDIVHTNGQFAIVMVNRPLYDGTFEMMAWPAESVRPAEDSKR